MINLKVSLPLVYLNAPLIAVFALACRARLTLSANVTQPERDIFPLDISTHIFLSIEIKIILN
ncbi:hypothetical protein BJJ97_08465 [Pectobacterium polaris]|nr:hypothetical protein BJJ97_08465 [Pectobacterium polaris]